MFFKAFARGMVSAFDLGLTRRGHSTRVGEGLDHHKTSPADALANDWQKLASDFNQAFTKGTQDIQRNPDHVQK